MDVHGRKLVDLDWEPQRKVPEKAKTSTLTRKTSLKE